MGVADETRPGPATSRGTDPDPRDLLRAVALWLALLAPLCWLPGGFARFVLAKLLVTALAVTAAALCRPVGALPRPLVMIGFAWAVCFVLAAVAGDTPVASLVGRWPRYEGLLTLGLYGATCWTGARVVDRSEAGTRRLTTVVGAMALGLAAVSVLDVLGVSPLGPSPADRSGSVLGNATDQGAVAMMAALLLAGAVLRPRQQGDRLIHGWAVAALVAALITVGISGSRTALALTFVGLMTFTVRQVRTALGHRRAGVGRTLTWASGLVALLGVVVLLVPTTRNRFLGLGTAEGRLHQWRLTLDLVLDHPVLGLGGSRYVDAFLAYEDAAFVDFTGPRQLADSPHSVLLQVLVAGGLVLLALTALGVYVVVRRVGEALRGHPELFPAVVAVAAYLALTCVNFTTAGPSCLAALLLGTAIAVPADARDIARPHVAAATASGALALLLAAGLVGSISLQRGVDAADRHSVALADDRFTEAVRWRAWDADTRLIAARVLAGAVAAGELGAAPFGEDLARSTLARIPQSYEALVALGVTLSAQGRVDEAVPVLDRAVALAPERPDGYIQRAIARVGIGEVDDALVDLRRAREILPRSTVVRRLVREVRATSGPAEP